MIHPVTSCLNDPTHVTVTVNSCIMSVLSVSNVLFMVCVWYVTCYIQGRELEIGVGERENGAGSRREVVGTCINRGSYASEKSKACMVLPCMHRQGR